MWTKYGTTESNLYTTWPLIILTLSFQVQYSTINSIVAFTDAHKGYEIHSTTHRLFLSATGKTTIKHQHYCKSYTPFWLTVVSVSAGKTILLLLLGNFTTVNNSQGYSLFSNTPDYDTTDEDEQRSMVGGILYSCTTVHFCESIGNNITGVCNSAKTINKQWINKIYTHISIIQSISVKSLRTYEYIHMSLKIPAPTKHAHSKRYNIHTTR